MPYHCRMNWNKITDIDQLSTIDEFSKLQMVMLFKHSTRCSISDTAKNRLEKAWKDENEELLKPYYLDLIAHRNISNAIADRYRVAHESPQVLIISKGECIFSQTHLSISMQDILQKVRG